MTLVAVIALALVGVAWVGYPLVAALLAGRRPPVTAGAAPRPSDRAVTVVLATREPPAAVEGRVLNLLASAQPEHLLHIVVAVDVLSPFSLEAYQALLPSRVRIVNGDAPGGKAATLNAGVRAATSEIVVFADSGQRFAPAAIPDLVHFLSNCDFGAVSGAYEARAVATSPLLRAFWWLETSIRRSEARINSLVAVTGAIYAMRKSLWLPLPAQLICDDLYVPLHIAARGLRVGFCESATASDARTFTRREEFSRKVRTLTGLLQVCRWCPWVLSPRRNPLWVQFVCHKLLRWATPYLLFIALTDLWLKAASVAVLWPTAAVLAVALVLCAAIRPAVAWRIVQQVGWGCWLQAAPLMATLHAARGRWDVWHHTKAAGAR